MNKETKKQYKALPKSIKIGQRNYKVIVSREDINSGLHDAFAYTMMQHDTIVVGNSMSAGHLRSTLLHEILHAIGNVNRNTDTEVAAKEEEEHYHTYMRRWEHYFIYLYSEYMVQVLRDNPDLVTFLNLGVDNLEKSDKVDNK